MFVVTAIDVPILG